MTTLLPIRQRTLPPTAAQARHARRVSLRRAASRAETALSDDAVVATEAGFEEFWDALLEETPALCWSGDDELDEVTTVADDAVRAARRGAARLVSSRFVR